MLEKAGKDYTLNKALSYRAAATVSVAEDIKKAARRIFR
jgi:hypothetical protein